MKIRFTKKGFRLTSTKPGDGARLLRFVESLADQSALREGTVGKEPKSDSPPSSRSTPGLPTATKGPTTP